MSRTPPHDERLAWKVLLGAAVGTRPTERQRLARGLPLAIARYRCGLEQASLEQLQSGLRNLWALAWPRQEEPTLTGWPALATACLAAADLLCFYLEGTGGQSFLMDARERKSRELLEAYRRRTGAPIYVLVGGAAPVRVFRTPRSEGDTPPADSPSMARCRKLLASLPGGAEDAVWGLERQDVPGPSSMAGLVLRELVARWPESSGGLPALGITGEFDERGLALEVGDITDKVRRFFTAFPSGVCFVPASQLADACKGLAPNRGLYDYRSLADLLIRLGVTLPGLRVTHLFERLRERSRTVLDWRRRPRPAERIVELQVSAPGGRPQEARRVVGTLRRKPRTGACIVGEAGSGKSMFLRRLHHELLEGAERWSGPSVRVDARRFEPGTPLASLIARELGAPWSTQEVGALLSAPEIAGSVWLLVDGVDEVPDSERGALLRELSEWPGRFVLTARPLRDSLPGRRLEMQPLEFLQREELLKMEGREDLVRDHAIPWRAPAPEEAPVGALVHDLCRTPFGISLVATLARPGIFEGTSRQRLLAEAIRDLVGRAVAEHRLDREPAVLFELRGERLLGAAAWSMLREARAELRSEDFDTVPGEAVPPLLDTIERSGLVQRTSPGRWAFNHKSFAEHCAARYLLARGAEEATGTLLGSLGGPGVDEVLLQVSAELPREALSKLLEGLLAWTLPLSALSLATRVLLSVEPSLLEPALATRVLERRLRLLTWLPSIPLPGGAGRESGVWLALERLAKAGVLSEPEARQLLRACHPEVQERLQKRRDWLEPGWSTRWPLADRLVQLLPLDVPVPILLGLQEGPRRLAERRGRGPWALTELRPYLEDRDLGLAGAAQAAWLDCAPIEALLDHLEQLSTGSLEQKELLLTAVLKHGSEQHKKEALLRAVVPRVSFRYWYDAGEYWKDAALAELAALPSEKWLSLWDWAWETGALGAADRNPPALECLYAHYLHDSHGAARWRAVRALGFLAGGGQWGHAPARDKLPLGELRSLLVHEPLPEVRIEVMELLRAAGVDIPLMELWPSLVTPLDAERWVAWSVALRSGWHPALEQLILVMARYLPVPEEPEYEQRLRRVAQPAWKEESARRGDSARGELKSEAQRRFRQPRDIERLLQLAKHPSLREVADDILGTGFETPREVLEVLLREGSGEARVWAVQQLTRWLFTPKEEELRLLAGLAEDAHPEVAAIAREALQRHGARQASRPRPAALWANEESVRGFDLLAEQRERVTDVAPLEAGELPGFTRFEALWGELERRPLELKGSRDMVGAYTDEAVDWFPVLARQAQERNVEVLRPLLERLSALFRPEFLPEVVEALDHPRLGYLASELLLRHPPGRRLLPAFQRSELAAIRASRIAADTALAPAALESFLDAVAGGLWKNREKPRGLLNPSWTEGLRSLGGLEGLVLLLRREPPEAVRTEVLEYIDRNRSELVVRLAEGTKRHVAAWARSRAIDKSPGGAAKCPDSLVRQVGPSQFIDSSSVAAGGREPGTRASALRLLALLGTPDDVKEWAARLEGETLSEPLTLAALEVLCRLGSPEQLPLLERMVDHSEPKIAATAIEGLARWADPERLLQLLQEPPAELRQWRGSWSEPGPWNWRGNLARGVVQRGTGPQALRLASLLREDGGVWELARDEGRLPEHALLVLGHVRNDPGDSVMPASVTGMGDEVYSSDVPEKAAAVVDRLAKKLGRRQEVVSALVEGVLQEDDSGVLDFLEQRIDALGGPGPGDVPRLLRHLREWPDSEAALSLLTKTGAGERELTELWAEIDVPWWPEPNSGPGPKA